MRYITMLAALLLAGSVLAGCGEDETPSGAQQSASPLSEFNQADLDFAASMSQHHNQAVTMAELAEQQAGSAPVKELAGQIKAAQNPEIDRFAEWIRDWGERGGTMPPHGDGEEAHGPGMMSHDDMAALEKASGARFDKLFLEMMIEHHQGAIEMARTEQRTGANPDAKALAAEIEKDQAAEITRMRNLLAAAS